MKSAFIYIFVSCFIFIKQLSHAQIGMGGSPHPTAILDLKSPSNDKVFLPPRITTSQRMAISSPPVGSMVFDTDKKAVFVYNGQNWMSLTSTMENHDANKLMVPIGGNSWITTSGGITEYVTNNGLVNWQNPLNILSTYVRIPQTGKLKVSINIKVPDGESRFVVNIAGKSASFVARGNTFTEYFVDEWDFTNAGYVKIDIQAVSKTGTYFGSLDNVYISGTSSTTQTAFVPNNIDNYFLWGRRGPSVHLWYNTLSTSNIEWFYNEITVPNNSDVVGSFFMANGFSEGYFGMQVNSPTERRILFSVWSPYNSNDPNQTPESMRVTLIRKGADVVTGTFGGEGTGGQSYLVYNWFPGNTYRFLNRCRPIGNNMTEYTAYFFAPEEGYWKLIASFSRPQTNTYLNGIYSFLENFNPDTGNKERGFNLNNQWIRTSIGQWTELTSATFTGDETANRRYRMDFSGGISNNRFFLRNCGFFNDFTLLGTAFNRSSLGVPPNINFNALP